MLLVEAFSIPAEFVEIPEAGHANVYGVGGESLVRRIHEFLERSMDTTES
jgi:hypothetical protein